MFVPLGTFCDIRFFYTMRSDGTPKLMSDSKKHEFLIINLATVSADMNAISMPA